MEVIYSASNKDETGPGASGQVQELQERSRTIRSITRMIRSSSRTTFTGVLVGFSGFKGVIKIKRLVIATLMSYRPQSRSLYTVFRVESEFRGPRAVALQGF